MWTAACSSSSSELPRVLLPCDDPAPLSAIASPFSLGYIIELEAGVDPSAEAARLASACGFQVDEVGSIGERFTAQLDLSALGCVRCDAAVTLVHPNALLYPH